MCSVFYFFFLNDFFLFRTFDLPVADDDVLEETMPYYGDEEFDSEESEDYSGSSEYSSSEDDDSDFRDDDDFLSTSYVPSPPDTSDTDAEGIKEYINHVGFHLK